jgi:DNA-binding Xre family transcriptional regulator
MIRDICPVCGLAASHNPQGGPCLACYRQGCSQMVDAATHRRIVTRLLRDMTATDLAELLGCTRQAVKNLQYGRVARIRPSLADAIEAVETTPPPPCVVCDDVDAAVVTSNDPQVIADRLGRTTAALSRHMYRCGRPDLGRLFAEPSTRTRYHERTSA